MLITGTAHPPPPPHYHHRRQRQRQPQRRGVVASWRWGCLLSIALVYLIVHEHLDISGRLSRGMEEYYDYYHHPDDLEPKVNRTTPLPPPPTITTTIRLHKNETFMWLGRQKRLCQRLTREEKEQQKSLKQQYSDHRGKVSSPLPRGPTTRTTQMILRMNCTTLQSQHQHGNLVYGFYAMHLAAVAFNVEFVFVCHHDQNGHEANNHHDDADQTETEDWTQQHENYSNLYWWLQSKPDSTERKRSLLLSPLLLATTTPQGNDDSGNATTKSRKLSRQSACRGMGKIPLQHATALAQHDLRHMALAIFGSRSSSDERNVELPRHYHSEPPAAARTNPISPVSFPLYPAEELDSTVIHFRCGDVLDNLNQGNETGNYGLLPFFVYREMLETALNDVDDTIIDSIGIVTAPFHEPQFLRNEDFKHSSQCQNLVESLQEYLQSIFPVNTTRVTIRNNPNDTIPMVYSRFVLATQACICIRSTFCVFPTLSSFAKKRIFLEGGVNYFLADTHEDGLVVWKSKDTPYLLSHEAHALGWNRTKEWLLRNTTDTTPT